MFETDPNEELRQATIGRHSESYYQDRYFVSKINKEFLMPESSPDVQTSSHANYIKQASFESSSEPSKQTDELVSIRELQELPKLSHNGTVVRLERDKVSSNTLKMLQNEEILKLKLEKIRNASQGIGRRKADMFDYVPSQKESKFKFLY